MVTKEHPKGKRRLEQEDEDKQQKELQRLVDRNARKFAQQLRTSVAAKRRVARVAKSERKQRKSCCNSTSNSEHFHFRGERKLQ